MDINVKPDLREVLLPTIEQLKQELKQEIQLATQTKYIGLAECAKEWGVNEETASRRLKKSDVEVLRDERPIRVNRKQFYQHLKQKG